MHTMENSKTHFKNSRCASFSFVSYVLDVRCAINFHLCPKYYYIYSKVEFCSLHNCVCVSFPRSLSVCDALFHLSMFAQWYIYFSVCPPLSSIVYFCCWNAIAADATAARKYTTQYCIICCCCCCCCVSIRIRYIFKLNEKCQMECE